MSAEQIIDRFLSEQQIDEGAEATARRIQKLAFDLGAIEWNDEDFPLVEVEFGKDREDAEAFEDALSRYSSQLVFYEMGKHMGPMGWYVEMRFKL